MNKIQNETISNLRTQLLDKHNRHSRLDHEVKAEYYSECDHFVSWTIEIGMVDDEGTAAQLICRDYRHIFIYKRGAVQLANSPYKSRKKTRGFHNVIYGKTR